jgi:hypothetical protein
VDPFYEPPTDSLIGVAYVFLDALSYLVEIHESITVINFKGKLVGELEVELYVTMENNGGQIREAGGEDGEVEFTNEEFVIGDHVGEAMQISITIKSAKVRRARRRRALCLRRASATEELFCCW